jgi:hypothetical protein
VGAESLVTTAEVEESPAADEDDVMSARLFTVRNIAIVACISLVLLVYVRSAWSYRKDLDPAADRSDFHNLIADALLHRQTNLRIDPPEGLLKLKDPYDPFANERYRKQGINDLSLYKGKLYAFYGPAPAILAFIPFRVLRLGDLSPTLAGLAFCTGGFSFSVLLWRRLTRWLFGDLPLWMDCFAVLALGLAVPAPFIIYIGRAYETSIACGYFLLFAGLYCLVNGLLSESRSGIALLALGSAAMATAAGARPDFVVAGLFIAVAFVIIIRRSHDEHGDNRRAQAVAVVAPYVVIGLLLALYNLVRFGSVTEFGGGYQLSGANSMKYAFYQLWYVPHGLYYYLFAPARLTWEYPYAFLLKHVPFAQSNDVYTNEPVAGILTNMPLIGFGLVLTATQIPRLARRCRPALVVIVPVLVVAGALAVSVSLVFRAATMRYTLDFAPLLLIAVLLAWAFWSVELRARGVRFWLLQIPWILVLAISVLFNLAITLTPCAGTGSC